MELKRAIRFHVVYDIWSCRRWIRKRRYRWQNAQLRRRIFGYDFERYGLTYDDKLCEIDIWEALKDYSCAYFIYTVQSSYIVANYSIRSDKLIQDMGNFPLWDTDFFKRDSRLIDSFSRHAHILDFDMLRLGTKMLKDNPNRNAFGFGVYVITEEDKERKNSPELQGIEKRALECNQKNDLFNVCLKMSRHGCVVANRVFVHIIGDLQRTGSLSTDLIELGDTLEVRDVGEMSPVLPWWSPFWYLDLLFSFLLGKHDQFYLEYRNVRGDYTLFSYVLHGVVSKLANYRERIYNLFGSQTLDIRLERGFKDGEVKKSKWFRQSKKVFSKRYATDCQSAMFEVRGEINRMSLDELEEYATLMATNDELEKQHSHAQRERELFAKETRVSA